MKTFIKPLSEITAKRSDHNNGYFIVPRFWGTCFYRLTRNEQYKIRVKYNRKPSHFHTYTKIPSRLADRVFFVYANYPKSEKVGLVVPTGGRVVGFDHPQASGDYLNRSFLVLSPSGEIPEVKIDESGLSDNCKKEEFLLLGRPDAVIINEETFFKGKDNVCMFMNEEGYQASFHDMPRRKLESKYYSERRR